MGWHVKGNVFANGGRDGIRNEQPDGVLENNTFINNKGHGFNNLAVGTGIQKEDPWYKRPWGIFALSVASSCGAALLTYVAGLWPVLAQWFHFR